jgi:hypothetical protein
MEWRLLAQVRDHSPEVAAPDSSAVASLRLTSVKGFIPWLA